MLLLLLVLLLIVGWINNSVPSDWQENNLKICKLEGERFQEMDMGWRVRG